MLLIPVKNLTNAKQRLASVLDQSDRTKLAHAMLWDVFSTIAQWKNRPEVGIVTSDDYAQTLADEFNFEIIPDTSNVSETDAIEKATRVCEERGIKSTLVIPGDIPLIQVSEFEQIAASAPPEGSVLVPASDGRGTNAALRTPADIFPLRFGNDSFRPHFVAAQATGKPCIVLSLEGIALDVDNPEDLQQLASEPGTRRSQQLARSWGFSHFPIAANQ